MEETKETQVVNEELESLKKEKEAALKKLTVLSQENEMLSSIIEDYQKESGVKFNLNKGKLLPALVATQMELKEVEKSSENPFFNSSYADLSTIIKETRPILAKHGLVVVQAPINGKMGLDKKPTLTVKTILFHEDGEFIEYDSTTFAPKNPADIQAWGSAMTYLKRYTLQSLLCISFKVEDDDGNSNSGKSPVKATPTKTKGNRL